MTRNLLSSPDVGESGSGIRDVATLQQCAARELQFGSLELEAHPNIVRLLGSFYDSPDKQRLVTVWELVEGKDLHALLNTFPRSRMPEELVKHYFRQLLSAVAFMHESGICHRCAPCQLPAAWCADVAPLPGTSSQRTASSRPRRTS